MVDQVSVRTQRLDRDLLDKLAGGDFRTLKYLENLGQDVSETLPDAAQGAMDAADQAQQTANSAAAAAGNAQTSADNAQGDASSALLQLSTFSAIPFVVLAATAGLANERVLTQGDNITITDAGAGLALTVSLAQNPSIEDGQGNIAIRVSDNGTASQLGFFGSTPALRPTTAIAPAAFVAGAGTAVNDASTFGGYTIGQIVAGLRALGILA